jgi:hypothetical protein
VTAVEAWDWGWLGGWFVRKAFMGDVVVLVEEGALPPPPPPITELEAAVE